jgi:putative hydroxymethylpyrimidine transport system substrate-binding protein
MRRAVALLAAVVLLAGVAGCGDDGAEPGVPKGALLVLDFIPNAVHTGIYTAAAEGLYEDEGVDLKVQPPGESTDAPKLLSAGKVEFAILDIHDLGLARQQGLDLVGVASIVQSPLAAVIARSDRGIASPKDLEGKTVGVTGLPSDEAVVDSELRADGSTPSPRWPPAKSTPPPPSGTPRGWRCASRAFRSASSRSATSAPPTTRS